MFSPSLFRFGALVALCGGTALMLPGCGGGGSGPVAPPTPTTTPDPTPVATATPPVATEQLFFDDFSSGTLNEATWYRYTTAQRLQRTGFGNNSTNLSENGTNFTRLTLDSYNPDAPGSLFRGTEIATKTSYTVGNGLEVEARLRAPNLPPGLIGAFFLISDRYVGDPTNPANYRKDEIDFEFLTKQQEEFGARNRLYTNVWNNWNEQLYGYDGDSSNNGTERKNDDLVYQPSKNAGYDYAGWNTYKIRWLADRTEFYVNDTLERTETEVKPDQAMQVHFNFWTPTGDFGQAFSGSLPGPVASANTPDRRTYQFDVDYVKVSALGSGTNAARVATGEQAVQPLPAGAKSYRTLGR